MPANDASQKEREEQRQFDLLRDTGVRALRAHELCTAIGCLKQAHSLHTNDNETLSYLVEALLQTQEFEEALPLLEKLVEAEPDNNEIALILAQTYGRLKRYEEMETAVTRLIPIAGNDSCVFCLAGEAAHGQGNDIMAIAWLTQALTLREDYAKARLLRAQVLKAMGQWNEVLADATTLTQANEQMEEAWLLLAEARVMLGQTDEAVEAYKKTIALNPFSHEAYLQLGQTFEQTGNTKEALDTYNEAIEQLPDFAEAYKMRGGVKMRLNDEIGAAEDLKKALQLKPELTQALEGAFSNMDNMKGGKCC